MPNEKNSHPYHPTNPHCRWVGWPVRIPWTRWIGLDDDYGGVCAISAVWYLLDEWLSSTCSTLLECVVVVGGARNVGVGRDGGWWFDWIID